jgi:orotate phosphoribosyltransferase
MDILQELDKAGAVYLDRHFIYTSGKHGSGYINLDPFTQMSRWFQTFAAS